MHFLVTGGTGFIGSALLPKLYESGFQLKALVRKPSNLPVVVEQVPLD